MTNEYAEYEGIGDVPYERNEHTGNPILDRKIARAVSDSAYKESQQEYTGPNPIGTLIPDRISSERMAALKNRIVIQIPKSLRGNGRTSGYDTDSA